jgi:Uma2 family endonuclease
MSSVLIDKPQSYPIRRLWTVSEFEQAIDAGIFGADERLELINGEILNKMPQNSPHSSGISALEAVLRPIFISGSYLRIQMPLVLGEQDRPEPDIAVVAGTWRDYIDGHPRIALLVVEVADSTLLADRRDKAAIYARAGVADYWILNLPEHRLEVYRRPERINAERTSNRYQEVSLYTGSQTVRPLAAPDAMVAVSDLLP